MKKEIFESWNSEEYIKLTLPYLKSIISEDYSPFWDSSIYTKYREQLNNCGYIAGVYLCHDIGSIIDAFQNQEKIYKTIYIPDRVIFPIKFSKRYPHFGKRSLDDINVR